MISDDIVRMAAFLTTSLVVTALTTRLKRTGEELRDSKASLEAAQRIAHVGWWERDLISGHVSLSDEVRRIFGVQPVGLPTLARALAGIDSPRGPAARRRGCRGRAACAAVHAMTWSTRGAS